MAKRQIAKRQITKILRQAIDELSNRQFGTSMNNKKIQKLGQTGSIDSIYNSEKFRRYLNISDEVILETKSVGIYFQTINYKNWSTNLKLRVAPFSESLLDNGQNTLITWILENNDGNGISGWITVLWNRGLASHISKNWLKYKLNSKIIKTNNNDDNWYISLYDLVIYFRRFTLGYDFYNLKLSITNNKTKREISYENQTKS